MSFLSGLLKIGGLVAAPFTAGGSLALTGAGSAMDKFGKGAGDVAQVAGGAAGGAANARQLESRNILDQNALRNQQYGTQQGAEMQAGNLDLSRKGFEEDARGSRAKQALIASILGGGFKPTEVSVPGIKNATVSGGLAESLKNPGAQGSMAELMKQALAAQMQQGSEAGEQFSGGKVLAAPTLAELPKAGKTESILSGVGLGGSLLASILPMLKQHADGDEVIR
jgi:hypothetical protein